MNKKIIALAIVIFISAVYIPTTRTIPISHIPTDLQFFETSRKVTIYVNTTAIDDRHDLSEAQKTALKNRIVQHVQNNYNGAVGAANVTVTNDKSQEGSADRIVNIKPGRDPNAAKPAWGEWPYKSKSSTVYLGEFMNDSKVNGSFKNPDGTWNTTKLGNAIGHTAGHEVGHSYSIGHNHKTGPKNAPDNRSKMTAGEYINATARAAANFSFDNHSKDVLRENWGKPPCNATVDYDSKVLASNFWGYTTFTNKPDEGNTIDVLFLEILSMPGFYELGFLGQDTDHGVEDGNPEFDFIYKTSLTMNMDLDAEFLTFIGDNHKHTQWLLRGTDMSPFPGQWFPLDPALVNLANPIVTPDGKTVYRLIEMAWPAQDVHIIFDALSFGAASNLYNGFTYDFAPTPPLIMGPTSGETATMYNFTFQSTYTFGLDLLYKIDWGDGTPSDWIGPFPQGMIIPMAHAWDEPGIYSIQATTKSMAEGTESVTSTAEITITAPTPQITVTITGGLGVNVKIKNVGDESITGLPWTITVEGGLLLLGQETSGLMDLAMGEEKTAHVFVLGLGRPTITANVDTIEETATGMVLLIFVLGVQQ
jgi:hypothetical protein